MADLPGRKKPIERLLDLLVGRAMVLSVVLLLAGYVGFGALPLMERKISFDENALLAGSARPTIQQQSPDAFVAAARLSDSLAPAFQTPDFSAKLRRALTKAGMEVFDQPFAVRPPGFRAAPGGGAKAVCVNMHAVLRSPRGDGKESIVLVTPVTLQPFAADFNQTAAGAALAVSTVYALALHLRGAAWLAKDVVWLVSDASCGLVEGVAAWVAEYQRTPAPRSVRTLPAGAFSRAGVMQQAVVVEAAGGDVDTLEFPLPGYDGQLPKLDMYWLLKYYTSAYVRAAHAGDPPPPPPPPLAAAAAAVGAAAGPAAGAAAAAHAQRAAAMAAFAWQQARGLPLGAHAPFKSASADAVTARLTRTGAPATGPLPAATARAQLAEALELTARSCSVLIEKFHHSFFLYVLVSARTFLSVDQYIGVVAALILVLVLQAAATKRRLDSELPPNPGATLLASDRGEWAAAARRVAAAHALCTAAGLAARAAPALTAALGGGGPAAAEPGGAGAAAGVALLAALGAVEVAQSLLGASGSSGGSSSGDSSSGGGGGRRGPGQQQVEGAPRAAAARRRRKAAVVQLSCAAAALAALACVNWALAFFAAAALAPLALARGGAGGTRAAAAAVAWAALSPPALLAAAYAASGRGPGAWLRGDELRWLLFESSDMAYAIWWGVYLPFWGMSAPTAL